MTGSERRVLVHPDQRSLAGAVAARFTTKLIDLLDDFDTANVVLSGGSVATSILPAVRDSAGRDSVDWTRAHFWWADERFVPSTSDERNDLVAKQNFLDALGVPAENLHAFPSTDSAANLEEACGIYTRELAAHADGSRPLQVPRFDITFLGSGPDGHVASLFPGHPQVSVMDRPVVTESDSPKPPPERLSLTMGAINTSDRVWVVLSGSEKAASLGLALAGAHPDMVPVAGVMGRKRTVFFVDQAAASEVPEELIASTY